MSNEKLAEALREILDATGGYVPNTSKVIWRNAQEALQAHAAEAAQAQATNVPGVLAAPIERAFNYEQKLAFTEGWNACREAMLAAAPQQAAEPVAWPFVESPGEIADRLKQALENGCPLLGAVRRVFIENTPLYTHPQPAQDAKLPSDEDFRLHLGELTPAELRAAQAAARYVLAGERAQDAKDAARFDWYFGPSDKKDWLTRYMEGMREGWSADQWRIAIDAAMAKESGR